MTFDEKEEKRIKLRNNFTNDLSKLLEKHNAILEINVEQDYEASFAELTFDILDEDYGSCSNEIISAVCSSFELSTSFIRKIASSSR